MIDTVTFGFYGVSMGEEQLSTFIENRSRIPDGRVFYKYSRSVRCENGSHIFLHYFPQNRSGDQIPMLLIEGSLPAWVYGTNVLMINDLHEAVAAGNKHLQGVKFLPKIDLADANIYRIDFCCNHHIGDRMNDYLQAIAKLTYPHRETRTYRGGTMFYAKSRSSKLYNKGEESRDPRARDILRQETTIRNVCDIKEIIGKKEALTPIRSFKTNISDLIHKVEYHPHIYDFTPDIIRGVLEDDLHKMKLDQAVFCNRTVAEALLTLKYERVKADRLLGFLARIQYETPAGLKELYGTNRTVNRNMQCLADAGVSAVMIDNKVPLPRLTVNFENGENGENMPNVSQSPSDTRTSDDMEVIAEVVIQEDCDSFEDDMDPQIMGYPSVSS